MLTQVQIIVVLVAVISFVAGVIFRSRFKNSGDVNDALLEDVDTLEESVKEWREKFYDLKERIAYDFPTYFSVDPKGSGIKENPISKPSNLVDIVMQVKSKGFLMRAECMQLTDIGIPVFSVISHQVSVSDKQMNRMLNEQQLTFELVNAAFQGSIYANRWNDAKKEADGYDYYEKVHKEARLQSKIIDAKWNDRIESLKKVQSLEKTNGSKCGLVVGRQFVVDSINRGHGSDAQD